MTFRDLITESDYNKAVSWFQKEYDNLKLGRYKGIEKRSPEGDTYTTFQLHDGADIDKVLGKLKKKFPNVLISSDRTINSIEIFN